MNHRHADPVSAESGINSVVKFNIPEARSAILSSPQKAGRDSPKAERRNPSADIHIATKKGHSRLALSRTEAAEVLGVCPGTVDRLVRRGLLRPSLALRTPIFAISELERFLRETTNLIKL